MKKTILITAFLYAALAASAQKIKEKDVPPAVKNTFSKVYPQVKEAKWEKEGENYEAEFEQGRTESSVLIDSNGKILETEVEIAVQDLPATVKDYVQKTYNNASIKEAAKITNARGLITYEAEIKGKDLIFDANGSFIKEVKK